MNVVNVEDPTYSMVLETDRLASLNRAGSCGGMLACSVGPLVGMLRSTEYYYLHTIMSSVVCASALFYILVQVGSGTRILLERIQKVKKKVPDPRVQVQGFGANFQISFHGLPGTSSVK